MFSFPMPDCLGPRLRVVWERYQAKHASLATCQIRKYKYRTVDVVARLVIAHRVR